MDWWMDRVWGIERFAMRKEFNPLCSNTFSFAALRTRFPIPIIARTGRIKFQYWMLGYWRDSLNLTPRKLPVSGA